MNIVIDQGNTSAKIAVFERRKLIASFIFKPFQLSDLCELHNQFSPSEGILSSVADLDSAVISFLKEKLNKFIILDENTPVPITISYKTPQTLGRDRISSAVAVYTKHPDQNILVIDAGTAITYDIVLSGGIYCGGNISPGMTTRFKALNSYTKRLPLLDENGDTPDFGYDTETAIRAGVVNGIVKEIEAYIDELKIKYPDLLVFLTGGHSFYFETKLKKSIFADGNLVLEGLNEILNYQYV